MVKRNDEREEKVFYCGYCGKSFIQYHKESDNVICLRCNNFIKVNN